MKALTPVLPPRSHHYVHAFKPEEPDYRIVYEIDDGVLVILVLAVGHRRDIYRRR